MKNIIFKIIQLIILPTIINSAVLNEFNKMLLDGVKSGDYLKYKKALDNGADINCFDPNCFNHFTPLHLAVTTCCCVVTFLIESGANIDIKDRFGATPLHRAVVNDLPHIVKILIEAKANIEAEDDSGDTSLHKTSNQIFTSTINTLIKAGANANATNRYRWTTLHCAAMNGRNEIVKALISARANIDARNRDLLTPLHDAARYCHFNVVKTLFNSGASLSLLDKDNKTVFDLIQAGEDIDQKKKDKTIKKIINLEKEHHANLVKLIVKKIALPKPLAILIVQYSHNLKDNYVIIPKSVIERCAIQ